MPRRPAHADTRQVAERYLAENRYFMLGSDLHNLAGLPIRMNGLARAIELIGEKDVWRLTRDNPRQLVPADILASSPATRSSFTK